MVLFPSHIIIQEIRAFGAQILIKKNSIDLCFLLVQSCNSLNNMQIFMLSTKEHNILIMVEETKPPSEISLQMTELYGKALHRKELYFCSRLSFEHFGPQIDNKEA